MNTNTPTALNTKVSPVSSAIVIIIVALTIGIFILYIKGMPVSNKQALIFGIPVLLLMGLLLYQERQTLNKA